MSDPRWMCKAEADCGQPLSHKQLYCSLTYRVKHVTLQVFSVDRPLTSWFRGKSNFLPFSLNLEVWREENINFSMQNNPARNGHWACQTRMNTSYKCYHYNKKKMKNWRVVMHTDTHSISLMISLLMCFTGEPWLKSMCLKKTSGRLYFLQQILVLTSAGSSKYNFNPVYELSPLEWTSHLQFSFTSFHIVSCP